MELGGAVGDRRKMTRVAGGAGWFCLLGSCLVLMPTARAGEWRISPFVEQQVTATDNVNGESGSAKESDDAKAREARASSERYYASQCLKDETMAESIAAPAFPVAVVEALQPSCTISTVSPTPASTESSARTV